MSLPRLIFTWFLGLLLLSLGCAETLPTPTTPGVPPEPSTDAFLKEPSVYYTHHVQDGNRAVAGRGALHQVQPIDLPLSDTPLWVIGAPYLEGTLWLAVLASGKVESFQIYSGQVSAGPSFPSLPTDSGPPVLEIEGERARLLTGPGEISHPAGPVRLANPTRTVFITQSGNLELNQGSEIAPIEAEALVDGRLLTDGNQRVMFLSHPTDRYPHGILGDTTEAAGVTILDLSTESKDPINILLPEPQVIEGLAPIWADLNDDGEREIIVTASNQTEGARILIYSEQGGLVAEGPAVGRGFRWRHQLSVDSFGQNGETELAAVLTPHIGGVVEFYRLDGSNLEVTARIPGHTSHLLGSRNLDMALSGDLDGDGRKELLVPVQDRTSLSGIRRTSSGAEVVWSLPVGGRVVTNIGAITDSQGRISVGVGTDNHSLRIWPSN